MVRRIGHIGGQIAEKSFRNLTAKLLKEVDLLPGMRVVSLEKVSLNEVSVDIDRKSVV